MDARVARYGGSDSGPAGLSEGALAVSFESVRGCAP